jgi:methyltransferase (TIGR00027 family)
MQQNKPSATARKVALNIIALGAKPGMDEVLPTGIVDATARLLVAADVVGEGVVRFAGTRAAVAIYEAFDWMLPGQFEAFAHRKAFCDRQVREGIAAAATQVLVLGAGYDTLGWRLAPEFPEVRFFEIDHPATARPKRLGLQKLEERNNLHLIAEDLGSRRLVDVVNQNPNWDSTRKTVVIAEGLTQYLAPEAVRDLFLQCHDAVGDESRIAFTFTGAGDDGRPDIGRWTKLVMWLLEIGGEPWLWSIRPEELPAFAAEVGWTHAPQLVDSSAKCGVEHLAVVRK